MFKNSLLSSKRVCPLHLQREFHSLVDRQSLSTKAKSPIQRSASSTLPARGVTVLQASKGFGESNAAKNPPSGESAERQKLKVRS